MVIDIGLREGSGFDVLKALFRTQGTGGPTRMMLTNYALEPFRKAAARWGAAHFFDKSSQIPEMLHVLREMRRSLHADVST